MSSSIHLVGRISNNNGNQLPEGHGLEGLETTIVLMSWSCRLYVMFQTNFFFLIPTFLQTDRGNRKFLGSTCDNQNNLPGKGIITSR